MKKYFISLLVFISFIGCFSKPQPPSWAVNIPQDNTKYFYASAQAFTKEGAIKQALNDIASRLNVSVSSNLLINKGIFKDKAYNEISQQINTKVSKIHFNNYKVIKSKQIDNQVYVLVQVDKNKLKEQLRSDIKLKLTKISNLLTNIPYPLQKIQNSYKAIKLIKQTKRTILMLQTLGADTSKYVEKLAKLAQKASNYLKTTKFSIKTNKFKQITMDVMSKYFNISKNANLIKINITLKRNYILRQYLIIGKANINFKSQTITIRFKGASYTNYKSAMFKASQDFKHKLESNIKKLLGLENNE